MDAKDNSVGSSETKRIDNTAPGSAAPTQAWSPQGQAQSPPASDYSSQQATQAFPQPANPPTNQAPGSGPYTQPNQARAWNNPQPQYQPQYQAPYQQPQAQSQYQQPQYQPQPPVINRQVVYERRPHRVPVLGPTLLIGAGVLFLLNNFGYVPWSVWPAILQLWPLLLIAIGLDLLIGRRNPLLSFLIILLVIGAGAFFIYTNGSLNAAGTGSMLNTQLSVPLGEAEAASVRVDTGINELTLDGEGVSGQLATGTLDYPDNAQAPKIQTSTDGSTARLSISQNNSNGFHFPAFWTSNRGVSWDIHLNPQVPTDLVVNTGTGRTTLDLAKVRLKSLNLDVGVGSTSVSFPASAGSTSASINGGVGSLNVEIPEGVEARVKVSSGLGSVNTDSRFTKAGDVYQTDGYSASAPNKLDVSLNVGVGSVDISTP